MRYLKTQYQHSRGAFYHEAVALTSDGWKVKDFKDILALLILYIDFQHWGEFWSRINLERMKVRFYFWLENSVTS